MRHILRFLVRRLSYDLGKGLLARPGAVTSAYALLAVGMVLAERAMPELTAFASRAAWIRHEDVAASQLILATVAGSMMTTVAVTASANDAGRVPSRRDSVGLRAAVQSSASTWVRLPLELRGPQSGRLLMVRHASTFRGSIDLAFNQLRQYGRGDMAVALRMVRALTEIALATDHPPHQQRALHHARLLEEALHPNFVADDREELNARLAALRALVGRAPASGQA